MQSTSIENLPYRDIRDSRGRIITVLDRLPKNPGVKALQLPVAVFWSGDKNTFNLEIPYERNFAYEQLLSNANARDLSKYLDKDLLLEIFDELLLPPTVRNAWLPIIERERNQRGTW